jgi:hypothetical protein
MIFTGFPVVSMPLHSGCADSNSLLTAAHTQAGDNFDPYSRFAENQRYLLFHNAGAIVLPRRTLYRFVPVDFQVNPDLRTIPASSQASMGIVTASFTAVRSAFRGLSKPRR